MFAWSALLRVVMARWVVPLRAGRWCRASDKCLCVKQKEEKGRRKDYNRRERNEIKTMNPAREWYVSHIKGGPYRKIPRSSSS